MFNLTRNKGFPCNWNRSDKITKNKMYSKHVWCNDIDLLHCIKVKCESRCSKGKWKYITITVIYFVFLTSMILYSMIIWRGTQTCKQSTANMYVPALRPETCIRRLQVWLHVSSPYTCVVFVTLKRARRFGRNVRTCVCWGIFALLFLFISRSVKKS